MVTICSGQRKCRSESQVYFLFSTLQGPELALCWYSPAQFEGRSVGLGSCFVTMATVYSVSTECNSEKKKETNLFPFLLHLH